MSVAKLILPNRDPVEALKADIIATVGDVSWFRDNPTKLVVAKFIRTHIGTSGTLLAAGQTQTEDKYQGKVGLVIKLGSQCFVDGPDVQFFGFKAKLHEWVVYKSSEGIDFDYVKPGTSDHLHCKILKDSDIETVVPRPDIIW